MEEKDFISRKEAGQRARTPFGELVWKMAADTMDGAEMTFGTCMIEPGKRNPLHSHPDCEEILYLLKGRCEHLLGDELISMEEGDAIRIPRGVRHWAKNVGEEPLLALIVFSSGVRTAINHEGEGAA